MRVATTHLTNVGVAASRLKECALAGDVSDQIFLIVTCQVVLDTMQPAIQLFYRHDCRWHSKQRLLIALPLALVNPCIPVIADEQVFRVIVERIRKRVQSAFAGVDRRTVAPALRLRLILG